MTIETPLWMQNSDYPAQTDRRVLSAAVPLGPLSASAFQVTQTGSGANMAVDIQTGLFGVDGGDAPNQGRYLASETAIENRAIAAAPASGQSRIDLVVLRIWDSAVLGPPPSGILPIDIVVITGAAATTGQQTAPAPNPTGTGATYAVLAQVNVAGGATSITNANIVDLRNAPNVVRPLTAVAGPPTSGTYQAGAVVYDSLGSEWVCIAGGSPGTWIVTSPVRFPRLNLNAVASGSIPIPAPLQGLLSKYKLRFELRSSAAATLFVRPNGDSTATHYACEDLMVSGTTTTVYENTNAGTAGINVGDLNGDSNTCGGWFEFQQTPGQMANFEYHAGGWVSAANSPRQHIGGGNWNPASTLTSLFVGCNAGTMTGWADLEGTP